MFGPQDTFACIDPVIAPTQVSPLHSQLSGVLSGLVFAGIILLLSTRFSGGERRTNALVLLSVSFVTLMLTSFDYAVLTGAGVCNQMWTMWLVASGLFGLGVLGVFCGLSWLVDQFDEGHRTATRLILSTTRVVAVIIAFNLWTTASGYLKQAAPAQPPRWLGPLVDASWLVVLSLVLLQYSYSFARRRMTRIPGRLSRRRVVVTAYAYLFWDMVATLFFGYVVTLPPDYWSAPALSLVVSATLASFGTPATVMLLQLFSLPLGRPDHDSADQVPPPTPSAA